MIAIEFDGVVVKPQRRGKPLELMPGVEDGLAALKAAGHILLLSSARANKAARFMSSLDPLVGAGAIKIDMKNWVRDKDLAEARYQEMVTFVATELPDLFDAIDNGEQGRPWAQLYIESPRTIIHHPLGDGESAWSWAQIAETHGDPSRINEMFEEESET